MDAGVSVGLGSDVAGGPHVGLLPQCGHAVTASRYLEDGVDAQSPNNRRGVPDSRVDIVTAFHVATAGGAQLLGINAGTIAVGKLFDAFVVNVDESESGLHNYEGIDNDERLFEKIVRLAGPSDITAVWVNGRNVHSGR
jgi:guanine deaminase